MAVILAESVAITKSRLAKGFNGDNLNLNGKVITTQEADKGFKAAGSVKPPFYSVMASGNQKGFAAGAASAFNDYIKDINFNKYNSETVFNRFFDDMDAVVEKCGIENGRLSLGIVCAYDDCVVAAKTGGCHLLRFSDGELFEIALSDNENGRGYQLVDTVADGDIFALVGEEISDELDYDSIVKIFDSGAELKVMIRDFFKVISASVGKDCSVILVKLKSDTERTYAAVPSVSLTDDFIDADGDIPVDPAAFDAQPPIDASELKENSEIVSDEENPENGKRPSAKKKILSFIPIAVLVIILAVTAALYISTRPEKTSAEGESVSNEAIVYFENKTNEGDDFNGSNGMQEVDDTEYGGDVGGQINNSNDNDDDDEEQTTRASTTTTKIPETTTKSKVNTTEASETTTQAPETTTVDNAETTTENSAETTTENNAETTTESSVTTTQAPEPDPEPIPDPPT